MCRPTSMGKTTSYTIQLIHDTKIQRVKLNYNKLSHGGSPRFFSQLEFFNEAHKKIKDESQELI